jgi:CRISPR-associated protein Cas2
MTFMILSGYRAMWIFAMFDLPTDTKKARKDYTYFRKNLLKDGFSMLQYSVYVRHCASEENADVHYGRVKSFLPPDGEVRLVSITDKQFGRMETFWGKLRKPPLPQPRQLELF